MREMKTMCLNNIFTAPCMPSTAEIFSSTKQEHQEILHVFNDTCKQQNVKLNLLPSVSTVLN